MDHVTALSETGEQVPVHFLATWPAASAAGFSKNVDLRPKTS